MGSTATNKIKICRYAFELIHGLSRNKNRILHNEINKGRVRAAEYSDKSAVPRSLLHELSTKPILMHTSQGLQPVELSTEDLVLAGLTNTEKYRRGYAWLDNFLKVAACSEPNGKRLLLERQTKAEIYNLYLNSEEMTACNKSQILDKKEFIKMFSAVPNVSIRKYKTVSGKCNHCATLTVLRQKFSSREHRRGISQLHALHRTTYMGERKAYYQRCAKAEREPDKYMSIIVDGMAQNHTNLPYLANRKEFDPCLDMHLEGVIEHGQSFTMYRTFNNVNADGNLTIHIILKQIEKRLLRQPRVKGKPFTLFLQVDGGSENANKHLLAMCEFLVARKIFTSIELTRLPVGHTHEDIDGKFGTLWKLIRNRCVITPQEYERAMREAFHKEEMPFYMEDIYAVPNYKAFLDSGNIDSQFGKFAKEELTQLCFRFDRFEGDRIHFPLCVRTMYRAYSRDKVYELLETTDPAFCLKYMPAEVLCKWGPLAEDNIYHTDVDGIHLLQTIPLDPITPAPFTPEYLLKFNKTFRKVMASPFGKLYPHKQEWESFKDQYPLDASVEAYVARPEAQYEIPLRNVLFGYLPQIESLPQSILPVLPPLDATSTSVEDYRAERVMVATHSIQWANNGIQPRLTVPSRLDLVAGEEGIANMESSLTAFYDNMEITRENLETKTVPILQSICKHYGIRFLVKGKKGQLIDSILVHFNVEQPVENQASNANSTNPPAQVPMTIVPAVQVVAGRSG